MSWESPALNLWFQGRQLHIGMCGLYRIISHQYYFVSIKSTLRKQLNNKRALLSKQEVNELSSIICQNIVTFSNFKKITTVALYYAHGNEVDLSSIHKSNKNLSLPVIHTKNTMSFHAINNETKLVENKYGIFEPLNTTIIKPEKIELCLMPLVGFNKKGHRLGMGGGYYDRYFSMNKMKKKPTILIGIAYAFQENDTIKVDPWDVPLDFIITDKEIIKP